MGVYISEIADKLNSSRNTISRELRRDGIGNPGHCCLSYIRYKLKTGWSPEQINGRMKVENKPGKLEEPNF